MNPCPKCAYVRRPADEGADPRICPACGVVYAKFLARQRGEKPVVTGNAGRNGAVRASMFHTIGEALTAVPENTDAIDFYARALTWLGLLVWGVYFIRAGVDWEVLGGSFLHHVNLPFHEFGHVLFAPFGEFMHILGGSLFQVLMPLGLMLAFVLVRRDSFGASVMLWWAGQNLMDVSPYIADGKYRLLPLIMGASEELHDWGNLLTMMGKVDSAQAIAKTSFHWGVALMLLSLLWGACSLYRQKKWLALARA